MAETLIGSPYLDHLHPDDRAMSLRVHQLRLKGQADHQTYEVRLLRNDGAERWVRINGVRYDWNGRPATLAFMADSYAALMGVAVLAGLGNAPFHPVDFTILNQRVSAPRLGYAFSAHGLSGNLGWNRSPLWLS